MVNMDIWIGVGVFIAILLLAQGGYGVWRTLQDPEKKRVQRRLRFMAQAGSNGIDVLERRLVLSEIPLLNRILLNLSLSRRMNFLLEQAGIQSPLGVFIISSLLLAAIGFLISTRMISSYLLAGIAGIIAGTIPYLYILSKKKHRMQKFERQLPEALDLIARSLKAGNAFTGSMKMVAEEMDDPVSREFDKTLGEINFGLEVSEALKNLSHRIECPDLRFFVVAINLQRESGGNLAETLENICRLIRERFKLQGKIKVLAAEGKLSATILLALPFLIALALTYLNPDYMMLLIQDPIGHIMIGLGITMMILGALITKKITVIKI